MLETVREFALDVLAASGEAMETQRRHAAYFAALARTVEPAFWRERPLHSGVELDAERGNLRAALEWAIAEEETDLALQLVTSMLDRQVVVDAHDLTVMDAGVSLSWAQRALGLPGGGVEHRVDAQIVAAWLAESHGNSALASELAEEALRLATTGGDEAQIARAAFTRGRSAFRAGHVDEASPYLHTALTGFQNLGMHARGAWTQCILASVLGRKAIDAGYEQQLLTQAAGLCETALVTFQELDHQAGINRARHGRGTIAAYQRDVALASSLFHQLLTEAWGQHRRLRFYLDGIAYVAAVAGQPELAARLYGAASAERDQYGSEVLPVRAAEVGHGVEMARQALGEGAFARAWAGGAALSRDQAVAEALAFASMGHASPTVTLTSRERELLPLLDQGMTAREIGEALFLSHRTIEHHIARLAAKLDVHTRAEILEAAREEGLMESSGDHGFERDRR